MAPKRLRAAFGLLLAAIFVIELRASSPLPATWVPSQPVVLASETPLSEYRSGSFDELVRRDPLRALELALEDHGRTVREYACTFVKQELLPSGMSLEQTIAIKYRHEPYSVVMHWVRNPGKAERVIYVRDRWNDPDPDVPEERELAVCQPGPIARLLVKSLKQPIHGVLAREASRRSIDEFGFARGLELLIKYSRIARERGELRLEFVGESEFDGRPTYVIERHLPYAGPKGDYPDAVAVVHLDKEWRIPVSVWCYANEDRTELLGRYEYSDVDLNVALSDADFDPATYGM